LNKKKIRGVEKYLVWWKGFMAEGDTWEKLKNLKNAGEALKEFEGRMNTEIRRQEKIDMAEERDFRRRELPVSRMKEVDLIFFIFPSSFYFPFDLFSSILFLEPGLGLE